jgi:hypothetical protein
MAATRVPNYYRIKKLSLQKKIKKKFQNHRRLSILNRSMLEFEARRSPYLESSSIITCGGPRSILAAAALRLR